jgi:histidine ammonia-lyase
VEAVHAFVRDRIPHREADYHFQEDLIPCLTLIRSSAFLDAIAPQGINLD